MKISIQEVEHVAHLARLKLSQEEKELFTTQLNAILEYMEKLAQVDTGGVEPTFHVVEHRNAFRDDEVKASLPKEEILANAPEEKEGYFRVPRVI